MEQPEIEGGFKIRWQQPEDLKHLPVNGAIGGALPDGSISVLFYSERPSIPNMTIHPLLGDRVDLGKASEEKDTHLTRTVQANVLMTPHAARQIGEWLLRKADDADAVTDADKKEDPR
jgi:hypothetical protein